MALIDNLEYSRKVCSQCDEDVGCDAGMPAAVVRRMLARVAKQAGMSCNVGLVGGRKAGLFALAT